MSAVIPFIFRRKDTISDTADAHYTKKIEKYRYKI